LSAISEFGNKEGEEWQRTKAIFDKVQAVPFDQRLIFLERECNGELALLAELHSLLAACQAEEALSESISDKACAFRYSDVVRRSVGPYELDRLLGRGGMGAVYLAHRADGHFHQQVAIKLIDMPLTTDLFRRQFRMERQILAGLSHPFIARLLDGGVSADGELYLAMEYVDGVSILDYCKQNELSLRARLLLFLDVCRAVQYAHQNLVVHRDLKPDNILVVDEGTPRLLDFGTAKLLSPLPDEYASELTQQGLRSFTPQYASPEQVLGKAISTASDTYSLGVILFQLLTETAPYVLREFSTQEMLRLICEAQPPKPSAVATPEIKLDADLDSIALMALRKEPDERYLTVDQFAADIRAWLDGRPVMARRGTLRYRTGKFVRRNKLALAAAALLSLVVLCGAAAVLWQTRMANLQRIRAEANAQEMRELSNSFLSEIDEAIRELPGSVPVRQLMVQQVLEHLDRLAANEATDRMTQLYLVHAYIHLADLQGDFYEQNTGDTTGALVSLDKAFAIARTLHSRYPNDQATTDALALAFKTRAIVLFGVGTPREAIASINQAIEILNNQIRSPHATIAQLEDAADDYHILGDLLGEPETPSIGDYPSALRAYQQSFNLYKRVLDLDANSVHARRKIAIYHLSVGNILLLTDPERAKEEFRQSLTLWEAIPAADRSNATDRRTILYDRIGLGKALTRTREYSAAISVYEQVRRSIEVNAASDSKDARAQTDLTGILGDEADTYVDMLNPLLSPQSQENQRDNSRHATELLLESVAITGKLAALDSQSQMWSAFLAYESVLLDTVDQDRTRSRPDSGLAASGFNTLRRLASAEDASSEILYRAIWAMLLARPNQLQETHQIVQYAERLAARSRHRDPTSLLLLAQTYRVDGQIDKAKATAREGLSLLPSPLPGSNAVRCRILLEHILSEDIRKDERRFRLQSLSTESRRSHPL
jgi:tetratricopeptide (TPR) repeat protein